MTANTDERLKTHLNGNQVNRERMCGAILAIDRRFSGVKPRHPAGGPDGGIDLEATFQDSLAANVAVGYLNDVYDGPDQVRQIKKKFTDDLAKSAARTPKPDVFVFFTNVNLTVGEKDELIRQCQLAAIPQCELFDRERTRVSLDSPDGYGIRMQYLQLPMNEAEQSAFFSRWGDSIQSVIAGGFGGVERALNRMQFLYEAEAPLDDCTIMIELDRSYTADEIGHFRLFSHLSLKEPIHGLYAVISGASDNPDRLEVQTASDLDARKNGIRNGWCGRRWGSGEQRIWNRAHAPDPTVEYTFVGETDESSWEMGHFTSQGIPQLKFLSVSFGFDGGMYRLPPYLRLKDLDDSSFVLFTNKSLAEKIKTIHVTGNAYKLAEFTGRQVRVGPPNQPPSFAMPFSENELKDEWVRIMRGLGAFDITFSMFTPTRMYEAEPVLDSLSEIRKQRMEQARKYRESHDI